MSEMYVCATIKSMKNARYSLENVLNILTM